MIEVSDSNGFLADCLHLFGGMFCYLIANLSRKIELYRTSRIKYVIFAIFFKNYVNLTCNLHKKAHHREQMGFVVLM